LITNNENDVTNVEWWKNCESKTKLIAKNEDLCDETLMMIKPCRQPPKDKNNKLVGGWWLW
jgi:hypothetical protein